MPTKINFGRGLKNKIPTVITDGMVNFTTDTNELFIDTSLGRKPIGIVRGIGNFSAILNDTEYNVASGDHSVASGYQTRATHSQSSAGGMGTITGAAYQSVIGIYNDPQTNTLFEIGNGTSDINRSNAFMVFEDGHVEVQKQGDTDNSVVTKNYFENNSLTVLPCTHTGIDGILQFEHKVPQPGSIIIGFITNKPFNDVAPVAETPLHSKFVKFSDTSTMPLDCSYFSADNLTQYSMFGLYFSGSSIVFVGILNSERGSSSEPTPPEPEITEIDDGIVGTSESTGSLDDGVVGAYEGTAEIDDGIVE